MIHYLFLPKLPIFLHEKKSSIKFSLFLKKINLNNSMTSKEEVSIITSLKIITMNSGWLFCNGMFNK